MNQLLLNKIQVPKLYWSVNIFIQNSFKFIWILIFLSFLLTDHLYALVSYLFTGKQLAAGMRGGESWAQCPSLSWKQRTLMCTWTESVHKGGAGKMWFSPREKPGWHRHTAFVGRQELSHLTLSCRTWPSAADVCWAKENSFKKYSFEIAQSFKV